jgi:hypothetical protein
VRSIAELVKTYKIVNDPNAPAWNVKFLGGVAVVAILLIAGIAFMVAGDADRVARNSFAATTQREGDGMITDYVGYKPDTFNAALGFDATRLDEAMTDWEAWHGGAVIVQKTPTWSGSHLIGYTIRYHY